MTRGKQKMEAQKKNAEKNQKSKGSQIEARAVGLKIVCPVCKVIHFSQQFCSSVILSSCSLLCVLLEVTGHKFLYSIYVLNFQAQLANHNQLDDHYSSKHPKETPPSNSQ
ncbi:hypothetical protein BUALT_Bualt05G0031900 [Buddleja alternifolia]|uniref:Small EDRK-rich factor-like N-terminal domain-containing protein n=1 Tax=Buddleja alternifolia TaxID=168488 RepID=A0AAV6XP34_9LAMI|nr:hypothetical protein BUALT_Bualt05G0031900 [Buddleja alternifolia]